MRLKKNMQCPDNRKIIRKKNVIPTENLQHNNIKKNLKYIRNALIFNLKICFFRTKYCTHFF